MSARQQWIDVKAWQTQDITNTNDPLKKDLFGTVSKDALLEGLNQYHGLPNCTNNLPQGFIAICKKKFLILQKNKLKKQA